MSEACSQGNSLQLTLGTAKWTHFGHGDWLRAQAVLPVMLSPAGPRHDWCVSGTGAPLRLAARYWQGIGWRRSHEDRRARMREVAHGQCRRAANVRGQADTFNAASVATMYGRSCRPGGLPGLSSPNESSGLPSAGCGAAERIESFPRVRRLGSTGSSLTILNFSHGNDFVTEYPQRQQLIGLRQGSQSPSRVGPRYGECVRPIQLRILRVPPDLLIAMRRHGVA
jgi:hypothetical protein